MAISTTTFQAPATSREGLVPSVYDGIVQVGAYDTPILSMIGTESVTNISHSWHIDKLREPKNKPQAELYEFSKDTDKSTVQKNTNAVQHHINQYEVTNTQQAVKTYGNVDKIEYKRGKTAKEHALDIEYSFFGLGHNADPKVSVWTAPHSRTSDTDPGISAGIFHFLAKGETTFKNGRRGNVFAVDDKQNWTGNAGQLTWRKLMEYLQVIYDNGETPKKILVGAETKTKIEELFSKQWDRRIIRDGDTLNPLISKIATDFGVVELQLHRYLSKLHKMEGVLIAGNFEYMKNGLLIPTNHYEYETNRTSKGWAFETESTLIVKNADAFVAVVGIDVSENTNNAGAGQP